MPLAVALMVTERAAGTSTVRMVNFLLREPAGKLMLLTVGEATVGLLLDRETFRPLAGDRHSRMIVPVDD